MTDTPDLRRQQPAKKLSALMDCICPTEMDGPYYSLRILPDCPWHNRPIDPALPELLEENIDSNDRLAEGLVRGVQEMGACQARLPVHIDGEPWDVTVRFRVAQPEPDPLVRAAQKVIDELDNGYPGHDQYSCDVQYGTLEELRTALRARAGSSPTITVSHGAPPGVADPSWVTGNEGKDEVESRGKDIAVGGGDSSGSRTGSAGAALPDPLASPAVVTPQEALEDRVDTRYRQFVQRHALTGCVTKSQRGDFYREVAIGLAAQLGTAEAELERMRAGGKS